MPRRNRGAYLKFIEARGCYYVQWSERGVVKKRSTGTADSREANRALAEFIEAREQAANSYRPTAPTAFGIASALDLYCSEHAPTRVDPARIAYAARALLSFWGDSMVADIDPRTCAAYGRFRQRAPGTVRKELGTLQAAVNYAHSLGRITTAPKVVLPPRPRGRERWLTRLEVARLLSGARAMTTESRRYLPLFILLGIYTGARKEAILSLRWTQVDLKLGRISFNPPGREQTSKRRPVVPISPRLMTFLRLARRDGSDLGYVISRSGHRVKDIKRGFRGAARRAGLHGVTPHTLRHTCGTWLAQGRVSMWEIAGYLGHSEKRTSELYAHHSPEFLAEASMALSRR